MPSKIASCVSLAFLVAGFFSDSALARRAYSTAEAEGESFGAVKPVSVAPVRKPKRRKARAKPATSGSAEAGADSSAPASDNRHSSVLTEVGSAGIDKAAAAGGSGSPVAERPSAGREGKGAVSLSKLLSEAEEAARAENYDQCTARMNDCLKALTADGSAPGFSPDAAAPAEPRETVDKAGAAGTAETLKQMAAVYSLMERPDAAARCMEEALRLNPREPALLARAVECLSNDGQFANACRLAEDYLEGHRNKNLSRALALTQARMGEFEKALATINSGFGGTGRNNTEVSEVKAEILSAVGDYGEALDVYEGLERSNPEEVFYPASAAELLRKLGKFDQGLNRCDAALKLAPLDPAALACRVRILLDIRRSEEAVKAVTDLVRVAPDSGNYLLAAEVFDATAAYDRGLKAVEDGIAKLGHLPELELARIKELINLGRGEGALDDALAEEPGRLSYQLLKLRMLIKSGQVSEAQKLGAKLNASSGWTVSTRLALAQLAMVQGHYMPAARALEAALRMLPRGDQRRYELELLLAANYRLAGEKALAQKTLSALEQEVESTVEGGYPSSLVASLLAADGAAVASAKGEGRSQQVQSDFYRGLRLLADGKADAGRDLLQSAQRLAAASSSEAALLPRLLEGPGKASFLTGWLAGVPGWNYLLPVMLTIWSLVGGGIFLYKYRRRDQSNRAERSEGRVGRPHPQSVGSLSPPKPLPPQQTAMETPVSEKPSAAAPAPPRPLPPPAPSVPQVVTPLPEAAPPAGTEHLQKTEVEDLSAVRVPPAIDEEKELDSSQNRRRYFSSFGDASASVEEIWNERLARLQMQGHGHGSGPAQGHGNGSGPGPGTGPGQEHGNGSAPVSLQEAAGQEDVYVDVPRPIELGAVGLRPVRGSASAVSLKFEPLWPGQHAEEDGADVGDQGSPADQGQRSGPEAADLDLTEVERSGPETVDLYMAELDRTELEPYSLPPESTLPPTEI
ncbi:MAG: hypothetical protein IPK73_24890 [Candidatus Obscuribacter sp.]|nr:hypothetical protein [Candidatus Obscuribacter sp.]MBK9277354.1 hypothetical protein [Candidatus Obscuribacter sp.]